MYRSSLLWIVFDVEALQLDELLEAKFAKSNALARIFPTSPSKILNHG